MTSKLDQKSKHPVPLSPYISKEFESYLIGLKREEIEKWPFYCERTLLVFFSPFLIGGRNHGQMIVFHKQYKI